MASQHPIVPPGAESLPSPPITPNRTTPQPGSSNQEQPDRNDLRNLTDEQILEMTQAIKDEEMSRTPLISDVLPISLLRAEYTSPSFLAKIDWLASHGWAGLRRARGDGDCFYRSLAFAYVERIMHAPDQPLAVATSLSTLESRLYDLQIVGFDELAYADFYETLRDLIWNIVEPDRRGRLMTPQVLLQQFQHPEVSNSVVVFFRLLTSAWIRLNEDDFAAFLFDPESTEPLSVRQFCENQVEATGREADHPQIQALSRSLKVAVDVAYVDGSMNEFLTTSDSERGDPGKVDFVHFDHEESRGNGTVPITLLYRPGHYDILEKQAPQVELQPRLTTTRPRYST